MTDFRPNPQYFPSLTKYVSFVDEGGHAKDPSGKHLCLAGLLAPEAAWNSADIEWRTACADYGLKGPFHMMNVAARKREFQGWTE